MIIILDIAERFSIVLTFYHTPADEYDPGEYTVPFLTPDEKILEESWDSEVVESIGAAEIEKQAFRTMEAGKHSAFIKKVEWDKGGDPLPMTAWMRRPDGTVRE